MLDIKLFRENPELIRKSEKRRFKDPSNVDRVIEYDNKWRELKREIDLLRQEKNKLTKKIGKMIKNGEDIKKEKENSQKIDEEIIDKTKKREEYLKLRYEYRYKVGNILHDTVPIGESEAKNEIVRTWGKIKKFDFKPKSHVDLVEDLDVADLKIAAEVAGSRSYYLKGDLVLLNLALIQLALNNLIAKAFIPFWTPAYLKRDVIEKAAELADFEEQLYKLENTDLFLIATSEQTLAALHINQIIDVNKLPLKYAGISPCYRREAGAHGRDTKGIFRVHNFEKVEQYVFCKPEDSWKFHEELILNAEDLYKKLEIPYRIVNIASGEMNDNAAKKYDLEAWFPAQDTFRELVSCSNCTDYQARKLNIRFGILGKKPWIPLHTLNSTAIATERTICAILENNQNKDGTVNIPKVLQPYMNNKKVIVKENTNKK
ncbi:MAG: serine--tRNA ligase [Candidatus Helarchaeota archaeon]|nr:serine--tRNA ligase [Candidatus Helarchaeota archaeon]